LVWGCGDGHGDYEDVLALEGGDERGVRGVVYMLRGDESGKDIGAFWAGESGYGVFAVCEKRSDDVGAEGSSSLSTLLLNKTGGSCFRT
jgi:hypothetical protein